MEDDYPPFFGDWYLCIMRAHKKTIKFMKPDFIRLHCAKINSYIHFSLLTFSFLNFFSFGVLTCWFGAQLKGVNGTKEGSDRASKMFSRDCQLMGLTWLLAKNKTAYIPTVSAVLRAIMYSSHPHQSQCSPDQENMPLAVDSLQFQKLDGSSSSSIAPSLSPFLTLLPLVFFYRQSFTWKFKLKG